MLTPPPLRPALAPDGRLDLPWPPTTNTYWRFVMIRGRPVVLISKGGREYRKLVCDLLSLARFQPVRGRIAVEIDAHPPTDKRRNVDLDNLLKGLLDSVTHAGGWDDDECIDDLHVIRREPCPGGKVLVRITPIPKECEP